MFNASVEETDVKRASWSRKTRGGRLAQSVAAYSILADSLNGRFGGCRIIGYSIRASVLKILLVPDGRSTIFPK